MPAADVVRRDRRIAVLASGGGSNLAALLAAAEADEAFGGAVTVVGADRADAGALDIARAYGVPTLVRPLAAGDDRGAWEEALAADLAVHAPDVLVLAGFMRILSGAFVASWDGRIVNTHPSLLPAFPGGHAVRDALAYGVKVTGATVHVVEPEVDSGPIIAQRVVEVREDDDEDSLHARIRAVEHELLPACVRLLCHDRIVVDGRHVRIRPPEETS